MVPLSDNMPVLLEMLSLTGLSFENLSEFLLEVLILPSVANGLDEETEEVTKMGPAILCCECHK